MVNANPAERGTGNAIGRPFTALVLAADRGEGDPVAAAAGVACKPLAPVGGVPMVLRVLAALERASEVEDRLLCGPPRPILEQAPMLRDLVDSGRVGWLANRSTPSTSTMAGLDSVPMDRPVLVTTGDHALLQPWMVDWFCAEARRQEADLVVAVAGRDLVARAYPQARRTLIKLRDDAYGGCNLFAFLTPEGRQAAGFWRRVEQQRKHPLRLMQTLGWVAVVRFLLRRMTLDEALQRLSKRMGLRLGAVRMPYPEAALDVDTVGDWRFVEDLVKEGYGPRELARHGQGTG